MTAACASLAPRIHPLFVFSSVEMYYQQQKDGENFADTTEINSLQVYLKGVNHKERDILYDVAKGDRGLSWQ